MIGYFDKYVSNTIAGSGNQFFFTQPEEQINVGRIFYKITVGGEYDYSLLFSNIIDSTFSDGKISRRNFILPSWKIIRASLGKCKYIPDNINFSNVKLGTKGEAGSFDIVVEDLKAITFGGNKEKNVNPGELFNSDPLRLSYEKGEYLVLEIAFSGKQIPNHEESIIPSFLLTNSGWKLSKKMPFPSMIGINRDVSGKVVFLGDSITQGIGTPMNKYSHWNAHLVSMLDSDYAYWNLGLGFARADDAASDGVLLYKAKQNDIAVVCFGVNDILQGFTSEQIKTSLFKIVNELKERGIRIILQTVPPFDYDEYKRIIWEDVNNYIQKELVKYVDTVFDVVSVLCVSEDKRHFAQYGGHPNSEGCRKWAEALYPILDNFIK